MAWSATQTRSDNRREDQRIAADNEREDRRIAADRIAAEKARQDATLQNYLDEMSGLMLREKLLTSKEGSAVRAVARTVTVTTLRRLNASRKGEVVRFLGEARLIKRGTTERRTPVDLTYTDLTGAILTWADLAGADLTGADLTGAWLPDAYLTDANLTNANLTKARLEGAKGLPKRRR